MKEEKRIKTIAVLPFVNMSANEENEYFSDGITEEIINALAKIENLKVTSRTSTFHFKNKSIPIAEIGKQLNVSTILEGSVRLSGNVIRITAQLINAVEDFHFWSETWDRKLENVFEVQDEISLLIADKLRENFGHFEIQEHLVEHPTNNFEAYDCALKAKFHFNKWNPEDMKLAIALYQKAIALDPQYTEAYLGLGDSYSFMATTGFMSYEEGWTKAAELTQKASTLNNELPKVQYQLANISFFMACDYSASFAHIKKALKLKPNYVEAHQFLAYLYILAGNKKNSKEHLDIALNIDPLSPETLFFRAYYHYMIGEYSKALNELNSCLDFNSKNLPAHTIKCYCLLKLEKQKEVLNYFENVPSEIIVRGDKIGLACLAYALMNEETKAQEKLVLLEKEAQNVEGFRAHSYLLLVYAVLGEVDKAFRWIENAYKSKSPFLLIHFSEPLVNGIKKDKRYSEYHKLIFEKSLYKSENNKKKALLDDDTISEYSERLLKHINEAQPYLDASLSLRLLASQIEIHPNQLSYLLNESIGKNFNEFINHFRVEAFIEKARNPKNAHITLLGLAFESGFNSKTVFNTYFKKETGLTPKRFLKETL